MAAPIPPFLSVDEFLDEEELAETKHMYYAGVVTPMAGGSFEHALLAMNLGSQLNNALRGRGYGVVGSDVMFQTGSKEMYTYPDLTVVCGPVERMSGRRNVITNPMFLVEVLSPITEGRDRGEKSHEYRLSPTLRQYALICQDKPLVEIHTRGEDGYWRISEVSGLESECEFSPPGAASRWRRFTRAFWRGDYSGSGCSGGGGRMRQCRNQLRQPVSGWANPSAMEML